MDFIKNCHGCEHLRIYDPDTSGAEWPAYWTALCVFDEVQLHSLGLKHRCASPDPRRSSFFGAFCPAFELCEDLRRQKAPPEAPAAHCCEMMFSSCTLPCAAPKLPPQEDQQEG